MAVCGRMRASRAMIRALGRRRYHIISACSPFARHSLPSQGQMQRMRTGGQGMGFNFNWKSFQQLHPCFASSLVKPQEYDVDAWTDIPYLEYVVGLEPEGSTPATSTGGSTLAGVRGEKNRPHPGYTARLIRLRIENGASVKAREAILDEKSYMRDFGRFWIPMLADLMGGPHHFHSLEMFAWMKDHPTVMKPARGMELERLYSMMISYAGVVGDWKLARRWFDDMEQKGFRKSTQCCNALIIAYAKNYDIESAIIILNNMKQYFRECAPNAMTYYILISMFARYLQWEGMEQMVRECRDAGFKLDMITYTTLLHAYAKMGRLDRFESIYQEMQHICRKGDEPFKWNSDLFTALLIGYSRLNQLDKVQQTIAQMQEAGLQMPQNIAVPAVEEMAKAYSRNVSVDGLEALLNLVETTPEIKSSSAFQSYIVEVYAKRGMLKEAETYLKQICDRKGDFVEPPALETVIAAFSRENTSQQPESRALERIYDIYSKAKAAGFSLSPSTYDVLISEFARGKLYDKMEQVAADMEAAGTKWPPKTLRLLYDAYENSGNTVRLNVISRRLKKISEEQEPEMKLEAAFAC